MIDWLIDNGAFYFVQLSELLIFFYAVMIFTAYIVTSFLSNNAVMQYKELTDKLDFDGLLSSPIAPSISIVAPAYNETLSIVDNIRSLLSMRYANFTLIVVNDGSKDDTLQRSIDAYDLEMIDYEYDMKIDTKPVRGVYKSRNPAFGKLVFVDKVNGGKADAINVGVNISDADYFACIDVDCILEPDAFLKLVRPIMMESEKRVVAVGGIVWLTNDSIIESGKLIKINAPKSYIARIQVVEYIRAFLLGRTAWTNANGLILISGAMGLFERKLALEIGGYNHKTVGEDFELVLRMHRVMRERKEPYQVAYAPEPLCWTEAPSSFNILSKQRNRWTRGSIDTLKLHKKMFFNPKYGLVGMLSYPYWFFAEWMAPLLEFLGITFFLIITILGLVNWSFFILLSIFVYAFSVFFSTYALFTQELSYFKYESKKDIWKLFWTILLEPFYYHPRIVWWAVKGNYDFFVKKSHGWGEMVRTGFAQQSAAKKPIYKNVENTEGGL
jgi:poly-beta-1,6-N-acetyl-D-glucosamine synthase